MQGFTRPLCLMMMLTASGAAMAQNPPNPAKPLPLSLTISAEHDTVVAGSPVIIRTTVTNTSGQDVVMENPGDMYQEDVRDAKGESPTPTKWCFYHNPRFDVGRVLGTSGDLDFRLLNGTMLYRTFKPGESITGSYDISASYNLEEPGTYSIVLSVGARPAVKSNPVTVTVVPAPAPASTSAAQQAAATPPFTLELRVPSVIPPLYPAKRGTPVTLQVVTKNVSTHDIILRRQEHERDSGLFGSTLRVDVEDAGGNGPPDAELGRSINHLKEASPDPASQAAARAAGTLVSLKPGEDWRTTIWVSDLYDLSEPGEYTVQVRRWDHETKTWVKSNTITVTVTP